MRQLGELAERKQAERLVRFLVASGTEAIAREEGNGSTGVWIYDETHIEEAQAAFAAFQRDPNASLFDTKAGSPLPKSVVPRVIDVRAEVFNRTRGFSTPFVNVTIAASVILTLLDLYGGGNREAFSTLYYSDYYGRSFPEILHGQVWRLVTPMLLHANVFPHLLFNMIMLYQIAGLIERNEGTLKVARFILITSAVANTGQYLWSGGNFMGMSGVVYGAFGYVWIMSRYQNASLYVMDVQNVYIMLGWLVACMVGIIPGVANADHLAGFALGAAWAFVKSGRLQTEIRRRRFKG